MVRVFTVTLPRTMRPRFPRRCVRCAGESSATPTTIIDFNGLSFFRVPVPVCSACRLPLQLWTVWDKIRTLLIAGASFVFGMIVFLPRLPGWATGLIVLALCAIGFAAVFVWNRYLPPAFTIDARSTTVDYEFANVSIAREFASLNGAVPEEEGRDAGG